MSNSAATHENDFFEEMEFRRHVLSKPEFSFKQMVKQEQLMRLSLTFIRHQAMNRIFSPLKTHRHPVKIRRGRKIYHSPLVESEQNSRERVES